MEKGIGSYMGDVKIIKKIDDIPELKAELIAAFDTKTHKDVSRYGLLLAEHIMNLTHLQPGDAIHACFDVNRKWQEGQARFQEARQVAFLLNRWPARRRTPSKSRCSG